MFPMVPMPTPYQRVLPNALTVMRLVLAAAFFAALNMYRYPAENLGWMVFAIVLFIVAAGTDALDGYLARRWQVISLFGRIMDPFCDKVLILGAFIYLAGPRFVDPRAVEAQSFFTMASGVYPWMVVLILARELLVTGIRGVVESTGVSFASSWSGKWKMILQSICIPIVLAILVWFDPGKPENTWAAWVRDIVVYATVLVTVWSGLPYITRLKKQVVPTNSDEKPGTAINSPSSLSNVTTAGTTRQPAETQA